jgi:hypothetical protein
LASCISSSVGQPSIMWVNADYRNAEARPVPP